MGREVGGRWGAGEEGGDGGLLSVVKALQDIASSQESEEEPRRLTSSLSISAPFSLAACECTNPVFYAFTSDVVI